MVLGVRVHVYCCVGMISLWFMGLGSMGSGLGFMGFMGLGIGPPGGSFDPLHGLGFMLERKCMILGDGDG